MTRKIAFFDVDKTIYGGYSANDFIGFIDLNTVFGKKPLKVLGKITEKHQNGDLNYHQASQEVMNLLSNIVEGRTPQEVDAVVKYALERKRRIYNDFFPETHKILKKNGYEIILISGGADFIIRNIAKNIGADKYYATEYKFRNGVYIPQTPETLNGELKGNVIKEIIDENTHTISFGDSEGDYNMFELTDNAFLYTTSQEQINEAQKRGWCVINDENAVKEVTRVLDIESEPIKLS